MAVAWAQLFFNMMMSLTVFCCEFFHRRSRHRATANDHREGHVTLEPENRQTKNQPG